MIKFPRFLAATLGIVLTAMAFASAARAGDAAEGQALASRWCSGCHNVGGDGKPSASDTIPTFDSIAQRKELNRVQLETWIGNPHPPMPNLSLTRVEIDNLVSYIESLRRPH